MPQFSFLPFIGAASWRCAWALVIGTCAAQAAVLTSSDGKTREFAVVVAAGREGLTVREAPAGKDIVIPWARLDARRTAQANPWFDGARKKATAGETVMLNIGLPQAPKDPAGEAKVAEWRVVKSSSGSLPLSAYVHREVAIPRLAVVWIGSTSPLSKREDAADLARRLHGALVVADVPPGADPELATTLLSGVADLMRQARLPSSSGKEAPAPATDRQAEASESGNEESVAPASDPPARRSGPAVILLGQGEAASLVWRVVCSHSNEVLAAVMLDGVHDEKSTAGAFATPCLFLESGGAGSPAAPASGEDLKRPYDLWRHFSTDGCRWCYASPSGDPLAMAVAFARDVAAASPYVEALELLESWEQNAMRHRIPMPVMTPKNFKEDGFRLATPNGASVFSVASRRGAARNDLVWVPSAAFATRLAGR
jgi:hypothetical protein